MQEENVEEEGGIPLEKPFVVENQQTAEWVLGKIYEKKARLHLLQQQAQKLIVDAAADLASFEAHFLPQVEAWAKAELESGKVKGKTIKTFGGDITFRRIPANLIYLGETSKADVARALCPEAIEVVTVEKVDAKKLKEAIFGQLEATGEVPEGVEIVPEQERMYLKFAEVKGGSDE